jgi:hypothetical protein
LKNFRKNSNNRSYKIIKERPVSDSTRNDTCPYCGAAITSEICPYCGSITGLDTANADMEYPVIECREAHLNFWNTAFPAIFAVSFGFVGFLLPLAVSASGVEKATLLIVCIPFALIGLIAAIIVLKNLYYFISVRLAGKEITGKVYGYMDDDLLLNGSPAQICKILLHTPKGPRFIMYQMKRIDHPYGINDRIDLKVYRDRFAILKDDSRIY